ncbi:uncharacterized protein PV09_08145 [Verruconis gallopava]|uniref:Fucose-specific lectin n=1 Tax=Verruconis gallopava TaxID=253628 RepID=A0A0D2AM80_9PEZI|nr:uncharacterized protein PV09_08145 [Verruconis gallopava]KIW00254.1 hypothetical protein PV09_08145 [Verruconis gallopava]
MSSPAPPYVPSPHVGGPAFTEEWDQTMDPVAQHEVSPATTNMTSVKKSSTGVVSPLNEHPDIVSPGMEAIYSGDQGKEVVPQPPVEQYAHYREIENYPHYENQMTAEKQRRRICGLTIPLCLVLLAFLIIALAVGLGVGLGVGLNKNHSNKSSSLNGNIVNPEYLSKTGAFNGTGLAIASYSFGTGGYGVINVYFQHWTGQLRKMQLMQDGSWQGGDASNIVATDARNATPISAVAYAMDGKATWHIFYIDQNNKIREKINDNTTNQWREGPIGDMNLIAMNDTAVGLQACWYGSFYGDANYTHSPIPGTGSNTTSQDQVIGMHLWYGESPTLLQEVTWTYNTTQWYRQESFVANGHAGIGCYSWGPGSVSYVMMVNLDNAVQVSWKDLNSSVPATESHPVNVWVNTTWTIPNVDENTSLGYTNYFYAQNADGHIGGYNITWDAENTRLADTFTIPQVPLLGTHFSVTAVPASSGGDQLMVFTQDNGTDITQNVRDLVNGQWTYSTLPIPQS